MSDFNIAAKSKEEQDKVNVDLAASGVAYKERLNMPIIAEQVAREQPEHLRESDPRYLDMASQNEKK